MPVATPTASGTLTTLQSGVSSAANGTALDLTGAQSAVVEISGTYANITANFEPSTDASTYFAVALQQMSATTPIYVAAATATGLYILRDIGGIVALRARTTIGAASGSMTVKGVAGY